MKRLADGLFHVLKICAAAVLALMVVMVFVNVVLRYALNEGITVSSELAPWCLVWLTYFSALVSLREHGHLGFDGVVKLLPRFGQRIAHSISLLLMIGASVLFLYGSWQQTKINISVPAPASGLSQGLLYGTGILFATVALFVLGADLWRTVTGRASEHELVGVASEHEAALAEAARAATDARPSGALSSKKN
jgi:TRAP-type C4-dicarboxylate transport system permease small subunit